MAGGRPPEAVGQAGPKLRGLGQKYARFIDEYFENGFNATNAGLAAGFNKWYGGKLLKRPSIIKEIKRRQRVIERTKQRVMEKLDISKERLIAEYVKIAFAPVAGEGVTLRLDENGRAVEEQWTATSPEGYMPVAARDKRAALADLAKMEGLFVEHLHISDEHEIIDNLMAGRNRVAAAKQLTIGQKVIKQENE